MKVLVTGAAGFIGFYVTKKLLEGGCQVIGIDNINDYYDVNLKFGRLEQLGISQQHIQVGHATQSTLHADLSFVKMDLADKELLFDLVEKENIDYVCHLAAQAGVRYSLTNPYAYVESNICGFLHVLEACRKYSVKHLVYASSSSVYGLNSKLPFSTADQVDHPVSLYAATKKSNELMAHSYSHLYNLPTTGLRFFTVYGPWGRPDMALFLFTRAILSGEKIDVYNDGQMVRDFTYVDDIVNGVYKVLLSPARPTSSFNGTLLPDESTAPFKIYNIGNNSPVRLMDFISSIEQSLGKKAVINYLPLQQGDVVKSHADVSNLVKDFDYMPGVPIETGVSNFINWYNKFYKCNSQPV